MMSKTLNTRDVATSQDEMTDRYIGMTGGEVFHEMMKEHTVETMFGYPGGAILPVYDAIYNSDEFKFVLS
ncbi:MAG: hypothetical protein MI744_06335, partial [Pseudomonadales bacterium]|nr:hypothetical protein [Pseudomonadales bacterium]